MLSLILYNIQQVVILFSHHKWLSTMKNNLQQIQSNYENKRKQYRINGVNGLLQTGTATNFHQKWINKNKTKDSENFNGIKNNTFWTLPPRVGRRTGWCKFSCINMKEIVNLRNISRFKTLLLNYKSSEFINSHDHQLKVDTSEPKVNHNNWRWKDCQFFF
jgi:hypothetical protein